MGKPAVKKIIDLKDKIEAYQASVLAARKGPARPGNLALASAAAGSAALAISPAAEAAIQHNNVGPPALPFLVQAYPGTSGTANANVFIRVDDDGDVDLYLSNSRYYTQQYADANPRNGASIIGTAGPTYVNALSANYSIANTLAGS